jgi:hypothetical protein
MGKLKYILSLAAVISVFISCKNQTAIPGPTGATGAQGPAGPDMYAAYLSPLCNANNFPGAGPFYVDNLVFSGYNPNIQYAYSVYGHKIYLPSNEQNRLPWYNVFVQGDELFSSMKHDTVSLYYYSSTAWPAGDSDIQFQVYIVPLNQ